MKYIYEVETQEEFLKYQKIVSEVKSKIDEYILYLKDNFNVTDLPRGIVWANYEIATKLISDIPIPAYTNDYRVVFTPDIDTWKKIYLKQLYEIHDDTETTNKIKDYYINHLSENHVLQILGHELAHHSEYFLEDFNSDASNGIWFEEGMVEYISRKYFLTEEEFELETYFNQQLVDLLNDKYGNHSLEMFGASTYQNDYASIFFEYWRSFLTVKKIIEEHNNDIFSVFESYHEWNRANNDTTLLEWFNITEE